MILRIYYYQNVGQNIGQNFIKNALIRLKLF